MTKPQCLRHSFSLFTLRSSLLRGLVLVSSMLMITSVHGFSVPANDGFVTDEAGILTAEQDQTLENDLEQYRQSTSNEIAVLIVRSLSGADLVQSAVEVGRNWGVGTKEKNNGVLMFIALEEREITIQVGYGLEGAVPDIVAKGVIEEEILPHFRDGDYFGGIEAGVLAIQKHIGGEYTADRYSGSTEGVLPFFLFFFFMVLNFVSAWLARSKSFWVGGVMGGVFGLILIVLFGWWLALPLFVVMGLAFDFVVSRFPQAQRFRRGRGGPWGGSGWGGGSSSGGGGFGGFSGGSFGGGGASGKW